MRLMIACSQAGPNGIESYGEQLGRTLERRGHDVLVVGRHPASPSAAPRRRAQMTAPRSRMRRLIGTWESYPLRAEIAELARAFRADLIHAIYPEFALTDHPTVTTAWHPAATVRARVRAARRHGEGGLQSIAYLTSDRVAYRRARHTFAVTSAVQSELMRLGIPCSISGPFVADDEIREPVRMRAECVMVAGVLDHPRKGLDRAIAAMRALARLGTELRLHLVGGWRDPERARTLPAFCRWHGPLPRDAIADFLGSKGILLCPSKWEEFGYVVLEGLAAGVPVVVGDLPAIRDLRSGGIVAVDWSDPEGCAAGILKAASVTSFAFPEQARESYVVPRYLRRCDAVL